jgi:hypothetical protein
MAIKRYNETSEIIGQFLPKIYTRRITLEDISFKQGPAAITSVTVDYHIKDVLDDNGIGVITQGFDGDANEFQEDILQSLKIGLFVFERPEHAAEFVSVIANLSEDKLLSDFGMDYALTLLYWRFAFNNKKMISAIKMARPAELNFQFRNTIYEKLDTNNNVINVIPYFHKFELNNSEWSDCRNLCLVSFSYFDFASLGLSHDGLSNSSAKKIGLLTSNISYDVITANGNVKSTARVYKEVGTNKPYYGPVHYHSGDNPAPDGYVGYMAGYPGLDMGAKLRIVDVPVTKVQDFRKLQRTRLVNYQPPQLEYFNSRKPKISLLDKRDKNYFELTSVSVDYDRTDREAEIEFTINMRDVFKRNSRYYDFLESIPAYSFLPFELLMQILDIRIIRRRVSRHPIGNDRLGGFKRVPYSPETEMDHLVVNSSQDSANTSYEVMEREDEYGHIVQTGRTLTSRTFAVKDYQISEYHNTDGIYQYGIEMKILDNTKSFLLPFLEQARIAVNNLKRYSAEAKIVVMETHNVNPKNYGNVPIGLGREEYPSYLDAVKMGNYDPKTKTFTREFKEYARAKYGDAQRNRPAFTSYVTSFLGLTAWAFGKSSVAMRRNSTSTIRGEDYLQSPLSSLKSLERDGTLELPANGEGSVNATRSALINMIDPINARPETIDSFLRSFEDLVLELEEFLGVDHRNSISSEGAGYSATGDCSFTVKRWINSTEHNVDDDTYIHMDPIENSVWWDYGFTRNSNLSGLNQNHSLIRRLHLEMEEHQMAPDHTIVMAPRSLAIGNWRIFFNPEAMATAQTSAASSRHIRNRRGRHAPALKYKLLNPADRVNVNSISNFVNRLFSLRRLRGSTASASYIKAVEALGSSNLYSGILALNDVIDNNIIEYGSDVLTTPLGAPTIERDYFNDPNECGLVDNTPIRLQNDNLNYIEEEGFLGRSGYNQLLQQINVVNPTIEIADLAPQLASPSFPTGGIFDQSLRAFTDSSSNPISFGKVLDNDGITSMRLNMSKLDSVTNGRFTHTLKAGKFGGNFGPNPLPTKMVKSDIPSSFNSFKLKQTPTDTPAFGSYSADVSPAVVGTNVGTVQAGAAFNASSGGPTGPMTPLGIPSFGGSFGGY